MTEYIPYILLFGVFVSYLLFDSVTGKTSSEEIIGEKNTRSGARIVAMKKLAAHETDDYADIHEENGVFSIIGTVSTDPRDEYDQMQVVASDEPPK